jgi:hypothetical protein
MPYTLACRNVQLSRRSKSRFRDATSSSPPLKRTATGGRASRERSAWIFAADAALSGFLRVTVLTCLVAAHEAARAAMEGVQT